MAVPLLPHRILRAGELLMDEAIVARILERCAVAMGCGRSGLVLNRRSESLPLQVQKGLPVMFDTRKVGILTVDLSWPMEEYSASYCVVIPYRGCRRETLATAGTALLL